MHQIRKIDVHLLVSPLNEVVRKDIMECEVTDNMDANRVDCRSRNHEANPKWIKNKALTI